LNSHIQISLEKPDWKLLKDHLSKEGRITKADLFRLVSECNKILSSLIIYNSQETEGNLLSLADPLTIVGDIHG
jgi:serine/threonine-protein phosphatase 2B catalytic subunit